MKKQSCRLENWEVLGKFLRGAVHGHPEFPDGKIVMTGKLIGFNEKGKSAETMQTLYTLGEKAK